MISVNTMKTSIRLTRLLVPLVACAMGAATAFVAPGEICRACGRSQLLRTNYALFAGQPVLTTDETSAAEKPQEALAAAKVEESEEEMTETQKLMKQVKDSGVAGIISYALWEWGFWTVSVPVCVLGYYQVTGHWPDLSNADDQKQIGAEAFAFVNFARFAVPLRIGLALSTTPWIDENIVQRFMKKEKDENEG